MPQELLGRSIGVILPPLSGERLRDLGVSSGEYEAHHRDGTVVPLEVTLAPFQSSGQRLTIARLGKRPLAAKSEKAASSGSAAPSVLDAEFLSILMHELRTPLQAMLGWTQLLRSGPRDAQVTGQVLAAIERNIHWQAQVVEDLLELAQILSGSLPLEIRRTTRTAQSSSPLSSRSSRRPSRSESVWLKGSTAKTARSSPIRTA